MEFVPEEKVSVNYKLAPGDKLFYCPYNRSHQVLEFKAANHLGVCRQAYVSSSNYKGIIKGEKIVKCRWRPNKHHLPASQVEAHERECEGNDENLWDKFQALNPQPTAVSNSSGNHSTGGSGHDNDEEWQE